MRGVSWTGSEVTLECESLLGLLKRPGGRARWQLMCNHQLFDAGCGVLTTDEDANGIELTRIITVNAITGNVIASTGLLSTNINPASVPGDFYERFYTGGYAVDHVHPTGERRIISLHDGTDNGSGQGEITLWEPFTEVVVSGFLTVVAGCDRSAATCVEKFNNLPNFGGFPAMPTVNPFKQGA